MAAQLRRLQSLQNQPKKQDSPSSQEVVALPKVSLEFVPTSTRIQPQNFNYTYVFADLRKTLIFAVAAVIFEIVLSLTIL
nr:hypothetical protein [uncultured archaeon]